MIYFKDIQFGKASAEEERSYFPELLLDGFLDPWDAIDKAMNTPLFLFLGYKGSGKSAIGQHLRLRSESNHGLFVNEFFLRRLKEHIESEDVNSYYELIIKEAIDLKFQFSGLDVEDSK